MTLPLFQPDGILRPPGVPEYARPGDDRTYTCPKCGERKMMWWTFTRADCDDPCDYRWERPAQLDHTEPLPF